MPSLGQRTPIRDRLWAQVDRRGPNDCWPWKGAVNHGGYGNIGQGGHEGSTLRVHRVAYELEVGSIPPGTVVMHSCDNPRCCNPRHLSLGTPADNSADAVKKGRQARGDRQGLRLHPERAPKGERNHKAKLTAEDVVAIRHAAAKGVHAKVIAEAFDISLPNVYNIIARRIWRHV